MAQTAYTNLFEITELQFNIMRYIDGWAKEKKIPIPQKEIVKEMGGREIGKPTVLFALNGLLRKGYLRRAVIISNKVYYVQLRRV